MNLSMFNQAFWSSVISNAAGTIIATVVLAIFTYILIPRIRLWVFTQNRTLAIILQNILFYVLHPYTRLVLFVISILLLYLQTPYPWKYVWGALSFIIFISFFDKRNTVYRLSSPSSIFSDDFSQTPLDTRRKWTVKTGTPSIEQVQGENKLKMPMANPIQATNSFLIAKHIELERGIIQCDIFLTPGSVINIVFFADTSHDNWYMARFDSRTTEVTAFLIKDQGQGVNWRFDKLNTVRTTESQWHNVRVEFSSEKASMFQDGNLLGEITNPRIFGKEVGFFNECAEAFVSNFSIANG